MASKCLFQALFQTLTGTNTFGIYKTTNKHPCTSQLSLAWVISIGRFSFSIKTVIHSDVHGTRVVLKQMPPRTSCIMPRSRESLILLSSIFIAAVHVVWTFVFGQDSINNVCNRHHQSQSIVVRPAKDVYSDLYGTLFSSTTPGSTRIFSNLSVSVYCIV